MQREKMLLVIDMLYDFLDPEGALFCGSEARRIIPLAKKHIEEFASAGNPIIAVKDAHKPNDLEFKRFPKHAVKGTKGAELIPEIAEALAKAPIVEQIEKTRYSAFFNTNLDSLLKFWQVNEAHVVGVCTNICVLYTVEELRNRDIKTVVYRSSVASFDRSAHEWALGQMQSVLGAQVK